MRARRRDGAFALLLAVVMIAAGSAGLRAQTPGVRIQQPGNPVQQNMPRSWYRNYDYGVEIDGQRREEVGLYQVVGKPYMLIYGPEMARAWVLSLRPKEVRPVETGAITVKNDIEVVLAESAFAAASPSPWANDGPTAVVFYGGSNRIRVARVPALVGEITMEDIFEVNPLYRRGKEEYDPDASAVATLKEISTQYEIEVWFGSWCPHCQRVVPRFMKVMQAVDNPNMKVVYHGVPRQFADYQPARQRDVSGLPTFIVMKNGREFTRLKGGGHGQSLEAEMAEMLASSTRPSGR
jgi:thiol-disulfide isomerase/thioredoxin